jgi:signal transduction histidine kinase
MNISVQMEEAETVVRFIVQDTGTGISDKDSDFIFVPFTKTTELTEGLGLGLPLTKRHARNLGGDLTLDPAYHDGCRFILELPKN